MRRGRRGRGRCCDDVMVDEYVFIDFLSSCSLHLHVIVRELRVCGVQMWLSRGVGRVGSSRCGNHVFAAAKVFLCATPASREKSLSFGSFVDIWFRTRVVNSHLLHPPPGDVSTSAKREFRHRHPCDPLTAPTSSKRQHDLLHFLKLYQQDHIWRRRSAIASHDCSGLEQQCASHFCPRGLLP